MLRHFHGLYSHGPYIALDQSAREDSLSYCKISVFLFIIKQKKQGWYYSRECIYIYIYIFTNISEGTDSLVDAGGYTPPKLTWHLASAYMKCVYELASGRTLRHNQIFLLS